MSSLTRVKPVSEKEPGLAFLASQIVTVWFSAWLAAFQVPGAREIADAVGVGEMTDERATQLNDIPTGE